MPIEASFVILSEAKDLLLSPTGEILSALGPDDRRLHTDDTDDTVKRAAMPS
jgi:hypothetical protein